MILNPLIVVSAALVEIETNSFDGVLGVFKKRSRLFEAVMAADVFDGWPAAWTRVGEPGVYVRGEKYRGDWNFQSLTSWIFISSFDPVNKAENAKSAIRQNTLPTFVVLHRPGWSSEALFEFGARNRERVIVVTVEDGSELSGPLAELGHASKKRPTGYFLGFDGAMPFAGHFNEDAFQFALDDFYEQGAGGCSFRWPRSEL